MISSKTFGLAAAGARDPLVFRRSAAEPAQILVTAQLARDLDSDSVTYAAQKFKFDLYRGGRLHSISEAEWQAGIELKPVDLESLPTDLYAQDERGLVTGFDQSGTRGTGEYPTLSLDRKQVAVPSYFGLYTTRILFQFPDHEFWYWDVFEVSTHKKLSTIRGLAMSVLAPFAPGSATWLPDNRLIISPGEQRDQSFIFCDCSNGNK